MVLLLPPYCRQWLLSPPTRPIVVARRLLLQIWRMLLPVGGGISPRSDLRSEGGLPSPIAKPRWIQQGAVWLRSSLTPMDVATADVAAADRCHRKRWKPLSFVWKRPLPLKTLDCWRLLGFELGTGMDADGFFLDAGDDTATGDVIAEAGSDR
ncbi:hypothetical protein ACLOJK_031476 [Asimina triloba]